MRARPLDTDVVGRSRLRAMLAVAPQRPRRYMLRTLVVALVLAGLGYLGFAVVTERLPKTGPTWLLYLAHDQIWLWLRGTLWTQFFPYSLVWGIPALGALLILGIELCTPLGVARLHRRAVLMARHIPGLARLVFPHHGRQRFDADTWRQRRDGVPETLRGGFILRVLQEDREQLWQGLRGGPGDAMPSQDRIESMIAAELRLLRHAPPSARRLLDALETRALGAEASGAGRLSEAIAHQLEALTATLPPDIEEDRHALLAALNPGSLTPLTALAWLRSALTNRDPEALPSSVAYAAIFLAMAQSHKGAHPTARRAFLSLWARGRLLPGGEAEALRRAETLIDFEFWANRVEIAAPTEPPGALLRAAIPGIDRIDQRPESFAWTGQEVGR